MGPRPCLASHPTTVAGNHIEATTMTTTHHYYGAACCPSNMPLPHTSYYHLRQHRPLPASQARCHTTACSSRARPLLTQTAAPAAISSASYGPRCRLPVLAYPASETKSHEPPAGRGYGDNLQQGAIIATVKVPCPHLA